MRQSIPVELPVSHARLLVTGSNAVEHATGRTHVDANRPVRDVTRQVDGDDGALIGLARQDRSRVETGLLVHNLNLTANRATRDHDLARAGDGNEDAWVEVLLLAVCYPAERAEAGGIFQLPLTLVVAANGTDLMGEDGVATILVAVEQGVGKFPVA